MRKVVLTLAGVLSLAFPPKRLVDHKGALMPRVRRINIVTLGAVAAALLTAPVAASAAPPPESGSIVVTRHTEPITFAQSVCDRLAQQSGTQPVRPCVGTRLTVTSSYTGAAKPTASLATIGQRKTWAIPGAGAGGSVNEQFTLANGVVYHAFTNCDSYAVPGFSVAITWCGATGSGTYTLTSGANFNINEPGFSLTGQGLRQTANAAGQSGYYCWQGPWVLC
jgi:hypothetical protein